jgi:glycosyltransferase involved in cell wall biosynthesis
MEVLPELSVKIPNLTYLIVGDGDDRPRLQAKAKELQLDGRVVFTGFVSEAEKVDHYRLADAYVMPGRGEGFGIVYLEAMACGIPTVGSKLDGSADALRGGSLGILVDPNDRSDIMRGIVEALARGKHVPEGLDYFSFENYCGRVGGMLERMEKLGRSR